MSLRRHSGARIVDAIAFAAERWRDPDFPPRVRTSAAVAERTGYSEAVVEFALDALFGSVETRTLRAAIETELGSLAALDGFVNRSGLPAVYFRGVDSVTIVSSDTTIGVAIPAMLFALCAKAHVTVKDRSDRLVAAFAETLAAELPEFADSVSAQHWTGHDDPAALAALQSSDVVVAYGGPAALDAIRATLRAEATFIQFGHRTSVGYIQRESLNGEASARAVARAAARDALLYDGEGCMSIHALFIERGGALGAVAFAQLLEDALEATDQEFPSGRARLDDRVAAYASGARFRAAQGHGGVWGAIDKPHLLVLDPPREEPPPLLPRTLALYAVDGPLDALAFVTEQELPLEAVGVAGSIRDDLREFALASGAVRIAPLGTLQTPPFGSEHGGSGMIRAFVRAVTSE